jgi:colanic acid/amylovoran biosynthesis protein
VDLLKFRTVQLFGKKNIMFASSPGPVTEPKTLELAKTVYKNFDLVLNREGFSIKIMKVAGFDTSKTYSYACPAYLFDKNCYPEPTDPKKIRTIEGITGDVKNIGFILATYSLPGHSFDDWERDEDDFKSFVELIEYIINEKQERVVLISHSNGFELPPNFKRTHWRDYKMITQLYYILEKRGNIDMKYLWKVDSLYQPWEMHTLIGQLDMLISGRVHGAVAGLEQGVPTLAFDYKNGPLAHKMYGFFEVIGMQDYVIPRDDIDFIKYFNRLYNNLDEVRACLNTNYAVVKDKVEKSFLKMKELMEEA